MGGKVTIDQSNRTIGTARRWWNRATYTRGASRVDLGLRTLAQHQVVRVEIRGDGLYVIPEGGIAKALDSSKYHAKCLRPAGVTELTLPKGNYTPGSITSILDVLVSGTLEDVPARLGPKGLELELRGESREMPITWRDLYREIKPFEIGKIKLPPSLEASFYVAGFLAGISSGCVFGKEAQGDLGAVAGGILGAAGGLGTGFLFDKVSKLMLKTCEEIKLSLVCYSIFKSRDPKIVAAKIKRYLPRSISEEVPATAGDRNPRGMDYFYREADVERHYGESDFRLAATIINSHPLEERAMILLKLCEADKLLADSARPFVVGFLEFARNQDLSPEMVATIILQHLPKSVSAEGHWQEVGWPRPGSTFGNAYWDDPHRGDPEPMDRKWVEDKPAAYGSADFELATNIINSHPVNKRAAILAELEKLDKNLVDSVRPFVEA